MMELPKKTPVRSYKTDFTGNETPISEGGWWLNGRKDSIDWWDVLVRDGEAFVEVAQPGSSGGPRAEKLGAGAAQDAPVGDRRLTAAPTGSWGPNQCCVPRVQPQIRQETCTRRCRSA
jgi:hypothetical protein